MAANNTGDPARQERRKEHSVMGKGKSDAGRSGRSSATAWNSFGAKPAAPQSTAPRPPVAVRVGIPPTASRAIIATLAIAGFVNLAPAQEAAPLFIEGDIVRGNTPTGLTGPVCVLTNQFKRKEKVVFRIRVRDVTGTPLDDKALKGIVVELSDGQTFAAEYRARPPLSVRKALGLSEPVDYFWSAAWLIPEDYPTGSLSYNVVATDLQGHTRTWTPFKDPRSLPMVTAGDVEYTR
jgi:hypothetical protein